MSFFVTSEGGLTPAGYAACLILIVLLAAISTLAKSRSGKRLSTRRLVFCSASLALALVTCMIKVYELPLGGSVTLCSMLFAMLPAWFYGLSTGLLCGLIYGILQFVTGPYILTIPQLLFDYVFAFTIMGLAGVFSKTKNGLSIGYIVAVIGRWVMATIAGLIWVSLGSSVWDGWAPLPYSMAYNASYIGLEAIITIILINLPAVKTALNQIKTQANAS